MVRRYLFALFLLLLLGVSTGTSAAQNSYSLWFANFWNNPNMAGEPVATASAGVINFDWGSGSPAAGVPADGWSVQWTSIVDFDPGTYRFITSNDDGVRVFLGWKHIITDWNTHPEVTSVATVSLSGGSYPMAVDFYDAGGRAVLRLGWERIGPPTPGAADVTIIPTPAQPPAVTPPPAQITWQASYWNNTQLAGYPALTRSETAVDHDWGLGSPAPGVILPDNFSARWSRTITFEAGKYRLTTQSDDGIRVYIDGNRVIDNWTLHPLVTNTAEVDLAAGTHTVIVEHFEQTGAAVARFSWEKIGGASEVGPLGVSATVTTYSLNFRAGPGTNNPIVDKLPRGTTVPVTGRTASGYWLQVQYQGVTGWVWRPFTAVIGDLDLVPVTA